MYCLPAGCGRGQECRTGGPPEEAPQAHHHFGSVGRDGHEGGVCDVTAAAIRKCMIYTWDCGWLVLTEYNIPV